MRVVTVGATRVVVITKTLVFKFPALYSLRGFLLGLLANMQEVDFASLGWPELCPVLFHLPVGLLVVQPYAIPLSDDEFSSFDWYSFCNPDGIRVLPAEGKRDSFGRLDGKVVVIDYGS